MAILVRVTPMLYYSFVAFMNEGVIVAANVVDYFLRYVS